MKVWIVYCGKKLMGRIMGRNEDDALRNARAAWGLDRKYTFKPVRQK